MSIQALFFAAYRDLQDAVAAVLVRAEVHWAWAVPPWRTLMTVRTYFGLSDSLPACSLDPPVPELPVPTCAPSSPLIQLLFAKFR